MNWANVGRILRKDLALGPRSPVFLWALALPVVMTLLIRGVFGGLFDPEPRLGIVDQGQSAVVAAAQALDGIDVRLLGDPGDLHRMVEDNDLDAGLVLPVGFDADVESGRRPPLDLFVGGESLASNRLILAVAALDLVRGVAGEPAPVEVSVVNVGDEQLPVSERLIPLIVLYAVAIAGGFVPGASLVEEKEKRTFHALLVTPTGMREILTAKTALGVVLSLLTGIVALVMNNAFSQNPGTMLLGIVIGGVMMAEFGLLIGAWAKNTNMLFTAWKSGGLLLFFPVIFPLFPALPQWIGRLGPTYYFLNPTYRVATEGVGFGEVWVELVTGIAICVALLGAIAATARWLHRSLASGAAVAPRAAEVAVSS